MRQSLAPRWLRQHHRRRTAALEALCRPPMKIRTAAQPPEHLGNGAYAMPIQTTVEIVSPSGEILAALRRHAARRR